MDGNMKILEDLIYPEVVEAKKVKLFFFTKKERGLRKAYNVSSEDRPCRRQSHVCINADLATSKIFGYCVWLHSYFFSKAVQLRSTKVLCGKCE